MSAVVKLPVISLHMPWAWWVAIGWKPIETRKHARFAGLVGRRIGIHAARKWDQLAQTIASEFLTDEDQRREPARPAGLFGTIIATAMVREVRWLTADDSRGALIECGSVRRFGLLLEDVRRIAPIACTGRQGLFYVDVPEAIAA